MVMLGGGSGSWYYVDIQFSLQLDQISNFGLNKDHTFLSTWKCDVNISLDIKLILNIRHQAHCFQCFVIQIPKWRCHCYNRPPILPLIMLSSVIALTHQAYVGMLECFYSEKHCQIMPISMKRSIQNHPTHAPLVTRTQVRLCHGCADGSGGVLTRHCQCGHCGPGTAQLLICEIGR